MRIAIIVSATAVLYLFWIVGLALCAASVRGRLRVRRSIVSTWARMLSLVMRLKLEIVGSPPDPPFCLVANHLSYVDVIVLLSCVHGVMVAKADVRKWPVLGHLSWLSGVLFIDRNRSKDVVRVNALIESALQRGDGVVFFPEGTSTRGVDVGAFRSPLLAFPAQHAMPVHYASITYRTVRPDPPASRLVCYWGDMTFGDHLYELLTARGIQSRLTFGQHPVTHSDRKQLAGLLREKIEMGFEPVSQEQH